MKIELLSQEHAMEIANHWHYPAPYDFYDLENDLEDYQEMVNSDLRGDNYYQVLRDGKLYGYFTVNTDGAVLELGLGMKPEYCGKGEGKAFMQVILDYCSIHIPSKVVSLSVADFNARAQQLYLNMGFEFVQRVPMESNGGIHLFVKMKKELE
ncbi:GNAT family N-acetyltransferase [Streptococcus himalayensis]|uniref:N-acetyltransferase n=1 Tax=Streptococcus himalayensis TaxID=1888195 RepID=A0A917EEH2_9STRE|nr:GNAT family N-acetyltransferase [Streptococcus himalayensis]GGE31839.1 N-acetyltransferase [Streptococcus himalayensis]